MWAFTTLKRFIIPFKTRMNNMSPSSLRFSTKIHLSSEWKTALLWLEHLLCLHCTILEDDLSNICNNTVRTSTGRLQRTFTIADMSFHSFALVSHGACVYGHLPNIRVIDGHSAGTALQKTGKDYKSFPRELTLISHPLTTLCDLRQVHREAWHPHA
jgi:hypothetical protein